MGNTLKLCCNKLIVNKLKALLCLAGKKDIRKCINSVLIEVDNGAVRGVATDGCILGVTILGYYPEAAQGQYVIPREFLDQAVKVKGDFTLILDADNVELKSSSASYMSKLLNELFPPWRRVIDSADINNDDLTATGHYDADILAQIAKAGKALGRKHGYFRFTQRGSAAALWQLADDFCGVVMPYRGENVELEDFLKVVK